MDMDMMNPFVNPFANPFEEYKSLFRPEDRDTVTRTHIEPAPELLAAFTEKADELDRDPLKAELDDVCIFFEAKVLPANVLGQRDQLLAIAMNGRERVIPFLCEIWFYICDSLGIRRIFPCLRRVEIFRANDDFIIAIEMPDSDRPAAAKYICIVVSGRTRATGYFTYEPNGSEPQISEYRGDILYGTGPVAECKKLTDFVSLLFWQFTDPDFEKNA